MAGPLRCCIFDRLLKADVAELVDALDLGSSAFGLGGSSPPIRTRFCREHCWTKFTNVDINLQYKSELDAELTIQIDPGDYQEEFEKEVKNYRKQAELPGFRKGKVPSSIIRKKLGSEIKKKLVPDTLNKAIQDYLSEHELNLLLNPLQIEPEDDPDWDAQDSFSFKYLVGLRPPMDDDLQAILGDVKKYVIKATEEEIEEQIEKIKNIKGQSETKDAVEDSDNLALRFKIQELNEDGTEMEEGFSLTKAVNLKDLPESLQKDLMDVNTEDELHLDLRSYFEDEEAFADFLDTDKLTVQDLGETISLTVQSIYEFEQATLDESIYQEIFPDKTINDEEGFKEALREALESSYERDADGHLFKEVKDTFIKNYNKGLPEEFLKRWFEKVQSEDEESENDDEKTEEERYEDFVKDIKWMVVVDGLADRYDISVENQEVMEYAQAMIRNEVSRIGMGEIGEDKVKEYAANYLQDQNNFYKSLFTLKEDKVFRKLKEEVTFQEEHLTYNEFHKLTNQDQATETEKATNNEQSA